MLASTKDTTISLTRLSRAVPDTRLGSFMTAWRIFRSYSILLCFASFLRRIPTPMLRRNSKPLASSRSHD
ncbi:uncharacterized protein EI90DRAFT_3152201, partial [Cantharellus anzutake]|uniref:uncharacterized protein n=1 Tax=Cantharellus anzutake TaxID=1750568 RepID=UPI0019031A05